MKKYPIRLRRITCLIVLFLCLIGRGGLSAQQVVDQIVAKVNDVVITQSDIAEEMKKSKAGQTEVLNRLINDALLAQEIEKQNIDVTDSQVDQAMQSMAGQNRSTVDELKAELARRGIGESAYKNELREKLKRDEFLKKTIYPRIRVSDYDLEEYYRNHPSEFQGFSKIRFLELLLTPDSAPPGTDLQALAGDIVGQLRRGAPFSSLVQKYSRGAFAGKGGDSGIVDTGEMRPDLLNLLTMLEPNRISDPIPTPSGIFIFKVIDRLDPKPRSFNEVKEWVRNRVIQERIGEEVERYLMEIRARSFVEIKDS
ncbi:MAG: peptidyl-prolyl cis-trans isomerase [Deltaproteobacteria bacterium]|nr:peptidyl-prolyl cis-trans isomerase [Deltaproteobacteria bacterium]